MRIIPRRVLSVCLWVVLLCLVIIGTPGSASAVPWVALNDCVNMSFGPYVTSYSGYLADGLGYETPSGLLVNSATGAYTTVIATLEAQNVIGGNGTGSNPGTDARNVFGDPQSREDVGVHLAGSASYRLASDWYYKVTFTGLDTCLCASKIRKNFHF